MASNDWAIVVGVNHYPGLGDLSGPENDARAFFDWVISPTGGNVPSDHVRLILSSDFPRRQSALAAEARPTADDVEAAFDHLFDVVEANALHGKSQRVGGRLYIYLAGHCSTSFSEEPTLLMADATRERMGSHVPGKFYANLFRGVDYFTEVVLFMDCSREDFSLRAPLYIPADMVIKFPLPEPTGKLFCGLATNWPRSTREREIDGLIRGVFTTVLLRGLQGAASQPDGLITAASLASYLHNATKSFLTAEDLNNPDISKEPEVIYDVPAGGESQDFVLVTLPVEAIPVYSVNITLPDNAIGKSVEILNDLFQVVAALPSAQLSEWRLQLPRGLYLAQIAELGRQQIVSVRGVGAEHAVIKP